MGYDCTCTGSSFDMKAENIGKALKALAKTHYVSQPDKILAICEKGSFEEKKDMFQAVLQDNGYFAAFDEKGNVCEICHETYKWREDNDFFDVFARFVEKGSYIEMAGEDGQLWRMVFDGEHCREVYPTILWPEECAPAYQLDATAQTAADFISNNPELARAIFSQLKRRYLREDVAKQPACKVTFYREADGFQTDVLLQITPENYIGLKDGFTLTVHERIMAYDALEEKGISASGCVIRTAEMVNDGCLAAPPLEEQIAAAEGMKQAPGASRTVREEMNK